MPCRARAAMPWSLFPTTILALLAACPAPGAPIRHALSLESDGYGYWIESYRPSPGTLVRERRLRQGIIVGWVQMREAGETFTWAPRLAMGIYRDWPLNDFIRTDEAWLRFDLGLLGLAHLRATRTGPHGFLAPALSLDAGRTFADPRENGTANNYNKAWIFMPRPTLAAGLGWTWRLMAVRGGADFRVLDWSYGPVIRAGVAWTPFR